LQPPSNENNPTPNNIKGIYMTEDTSLSPSSSGVSKTAARTAVVLAGIFLAILFLLHFLEPEFDPSWRMISEYEIGRYGWMMRLAFFCWGGSVLALLVALWHSLRTTGGKIGRWWLLLIAVAMIGAGIFITNAITDTTINTSNSLHSLCGAFVILTFPIAASLVAGSLARNQEWAAARRRLFWGTLLVWLSMLAFFGSIIVSRAFNPSAGRVGPDVLLGWPNRFMVLVYNIWLIILALQAGQMPAKTVDKMP
jgi:hypothetical protein